MCVDLRGQIACKIVISYYYIISLFYVYCQQILYLNNFLRYHCSQSVLIMLQESQETKYDTNKD